MDLLQSVPEEKNFGSVRKESHYATPNGESTDSCIGEPLELQGMNSRLEQIENHHATPIEESAFDSTCDNPYDLG